MGRVNFGIEGFDDILPGGLIEGNSYLVEGAPGTGKTTFGVQFLYEGALTYGEPGILLTFEQFPEQLYADSLNFGWNLKQLEAEDKLRVVFTSPDVLLKDAEGSVVRRLVDEIGAKRIYVDSLSHLKETAASRKSRETVFRLVNLIKRCGLTSLFASEVERDSDGYERFLFDGLIRLSNKPYQTRGRQRTIEVIKSRVQPHLSGEHSLQITERGIVVYPRIRVIDEPPDFGKERVSTGIKGLDRLLGGGFLRGTSSVVSGASGLGKSLLGLQFLLAGAKGGEKGAFVSLEERPKELLRFASGFSFEFSEFVEDGTVSLLYRVPAELDFYELGCAIQRLCEQRSISRLVFDSISTLAVRIPEEHQFRNQVYLLVDYLKSRGITTILIDETHELFEQPLVTTHGVSSVVDTAILMRYVEVNAKMFRVLTVLKSRGVSHSKDIVGYEITGDGIVIGERFKSLGGLLRGSPHKSSIDERVIKKMRL